MLTSLCACALLVPVAALAAPSITEFASGLQGASGPRTSSVLGGVVTGPDGNVWFTDDGSVPAIGKVTPSGQITEYTTGLEGSDASHPVDIATGADGNLWFTDEGATAAIGKITPSGQITEYTAGLQANNASCPTAITKGPDGNVWFTDQGSRCGSGFGANAIGRVTPAGEITEYSTGLQDRNLSNPTAITTGPDGNLWFTDAGVANLGGSAIGKITPVGAITEYPLGGKSLPADIIAGPDGNLWFTDQGGSRAVGEITPAGTITAYATNLQAANQSLPSNLAVAADGNIWFTDPGQTPELGEITTAGAITETPITLPAGTSSPEDLTEGPDNNLWMTDTGTGQLARIILGETPSIGAPTVSGITTTGATITATVNPLGAPVSSIAIQYGADTNYGQTVQTTPSALPLSGTPTTVTATLTGLTPGSTIHYRIVVTNTAGTTTGPDYYITTQNQIGNTATGSTGMGGGDGVLDIPVISAVSETHTRWREGNLAAKITSGLRGQRDAPIGTKYVFTLNELAPVTIAFTRHSTGRQTRAGCLPATKRNARHKSCGISTPSGQLSVTAHPGVNTLRFDGLLSPKKRLPLGDYSVVITADSGGLPAASASLNFAIVGTSTPR
ncbi:MAG: hypothetical protein ACLPZR_10735 [Solirubrobacteraceae bacterium]